MKGKGGRRERNFQPPSEAGARVLGSQTIWEKRRWGEISLRSGCTVAGSSKFNRGKGEERKNELQKAHGKGQWMVHH